jgi:hypothetical protein
MEEAAMRNRNKRGALKLVCKETACYAKTSAGKRKYRRMARRHAKQIESTLPEKATIWRKRARNG